MAELLKRCMPPCERSLSEGDLHEFCLECLGEEHARLGLQGDCEYCDLLPIKVLRARLAFFKEKPRAAAHSWGSRADLADVHETEFPLSLNNMLKPITASTGGSVLLPCSCTDLHTTLEIFTWWKLRNENEWVEIYPKLDQYKDRFQFVNNHTPGNLSLLISHLTVEDGGDYRCRVNKSEYRDFRLTVEGCLWNQKRFTVFGDIGESVLLPCSCFQLQAKPDTFRWLYLKGSDEKEISPKDETGRYTDRVQLFNDHHPGNLSLLISHLTVEDGGRYRCQLSKNDVKYVSVSVKGVTPQTRDSSGKDPLPSVAVVTVIFLHIIVAVVD